MGKRLTRGIAAELRVELKILASGCQSWLDAWRVLPDDLDEVDRFMVDVSANGDEAMRSRAADVSRLIAPIAARARAGYLSPADVEGLKEDVGRLIEREKQELDHRTSRSLYSALHSRLENHVLLICGAPLGIAARAAHIRAMMGGQPHPSLEDLDGVLASLSRAAIARDLAALAAATASVDAAVAKIPNAPVSRSNLDTSVGEASRWTVLCVEDDEQVWGGKLERTIELVQLKLGACCDVRHHLVADRESAEQHLAHLARSDHRAIAVLDLCLPTRAGAAASRDEGIMLLRHCRSPKRNVPVIVLTTAPNFLGDHQMAAELGVSDYLLKGVDSEERLCEALVRIVGTRPRRTLQVFEDTGTLVRVDDIDVPLSPAVFRTLDVLAAASYEKGAPQALTPEEIAEQERGAPDDVSTTLTGAETNASGNIRRFWTVTGKRVRNPEDAARELLERLPYRLRRSLEKELRDAGVSPANWLQVAKYLDRHYGTTELADGVSVQKRVSEARRAIIEAFNAAGRTIVPEEEVIANDQAGESRFAYKVVAKVTYPRPTSRKGQGQCCVLVVDDDDLWRRLVAELLELHGYDVKSAGCTEEALELAQKHRPDVLCLDMHFPWHRVPRGCESGADEADAGLQLLEKVQHFLPKVRAVGFSGFTQSDAIRERAARLGVRVGDFVSKEITTANPWQSLLVLKIYRVEQEIRRGAVMPLPNMTRLPYIHLWRRERQRVEIFGRPWDAPENQIRLLWVLAERAGDPVPHEDIIAAIWPPHPKNDERLKTLVRRFRMSIQNDWLAIADEEAGKPLREAILANVNKVCYVLNARVRIDA